jgi:hypothetical protein
MGHGDGQALLLCLLDHGRDAMSNALIAGLLNRLNENQLALGAAVEELRVWVGQR